MIVAQACTGLESTASNKKFMYKFSAVPPNSKLGRGYSERPSEDELSLWQNPYVGRSVQFVSTCKLT